MKSRTFTVALAFGLLVLSGCGTPDAGDESVETESSVSSSEHKSPSPGEESSHVESRVTVSVDDGQGTYTIKDTEDDITEKVGFSGEEVVDIDNRVYSVYVEADQDGSQVTCEVTVDGETVANDKSSDGPARCWPAPA